MGIIYKIRCLDEAITDIYIGSTDRGLGVRKSQHKSDYSKTPNRKVYKFISEHGGWENWEMVEIDSIQGDAKVLRRAERYWCDKLLPTLNKNKINPTPEESLQIKKDYYQANREKFLERSTQYRKDFPEEVRAYQVKYRKENSDLVRARQLQKFECECGGRYFYCNKIRHHNTNKHLKWVEKNQSDSDKSEDSEESVDSVGV